MKKFSIKRFMATAGAIGLTLGCVGCGIAPSAGGTSSGSSSSSSGSSSNSSSSSSGHTSNNHNNGKINADYMKNLTIDSMTISFYDGYNYSTAEAINSFGEITLSEYVIDLDEDQIQRVQDTLTDIKPVGDDNFIALLDEYKICINGDIYLSCDAYRYLWDDESFVTFSDEEFNNVVNDIATEYMQNNVFIAPFENGIDFIIHDGDSIEITDEVVSKLGEYSFSRVEIETDYSEYGEISDVITLSDGNVLLLFADDDNYGYLDGSDYGFYVIMNDVDMRSLVEYLEIVYNNQQNNFGAAYDYSPVIINCGDKSYCADDELAESIKAETREMEYKQYDWLSGNYEMEESIEISIDDGFYYIPVDPSYLNRYYKAADGSLYFVDPFSQAVENSIFEMCGIAR